MEINLIPSPLTLLRSGCTGEGGKEIKAIKKLRVVSILPFFVPSLLRSHHVSETLSFKVAFPLPSPPTAAKHTYEQRGHLENVNQILKNRLEWFLIFLLQ